MKPTAGSPFACAFAFACASAWACTGGGGAFPDVPDIERANVSNERANAGSTTATAVPTATGRVTEDRDDPPSAGPPARSSDCAGTYTCRQSGSTQTTSVKLERSGEICKGDSFQLESDGRVTTNGTSVGNWTGSAAGLNVTLGGVTLTCTKG